MDKRSLGLSGYRVVARSKNRRLALVSLAETRVQAVRLAEEFTQKVERRHLQADRGSVGEQKPDPNDPGREVDRYGNGRILEATICRGGRARLSDRSLAGPITNTGDVPSGIQAGKSLATGLFVFLQ